MVTSSDAMIDRPMIVWTVERFVIHPRVDQVTVVVTPGEESQIASVLDQHGEAAVEPGVAHSSLDARLFERDFDCLAAMNDVLSQGLLDAARQNVGGLNQVLWRNRQVGIQNH